MTRDGFDGEVDMRRLLPVLLLMGLGLGLSACVVAPGPGGGWCYWHPHRC